MIENKKLNIFIYILIGLAFLLLLFVFTLTPVKAETLTRDLNSYAYLRKAVDNEEITRRTPANDNTYNSLNYNETLGSYVFWPLDIGASQFTDNNISYDARISNVYLNSYVLANQCSNNCDLPIAFNLQWNTNVSNSSSNAEITLQTQIAWFLNNYNKVYIVFTDNNDKVWRTKLNTNVLNAYQYVEDNKTYYYLNIYYTLTLYNVKYINYIDIEFPLSAYQEQKDAHTNNNISWSNTSLTFKTFAYSYQSYTGGSNGTDGTDNDAEQIQQLQQQTNEKLNDIRLQMLSEELPDTMGLGNSAGWLPAGPIDSVLNLPLTFFNGLNNALSSSCSPVNVPIPFVNQNFQLPCGNTLMAQINGFPAWWTSIGLIASAFILYKYLLHLYQWVDDTLTFRENNWQDWGGI